MLRKIIFCALSVFLLASCGEKKADASTHAHVTHKGSTFNENAEFHEPELLKAGEGVARIDFKSKTRVEADIHEGDLVTQIYEFTNTGNADLVIYNVSAECDCLEVSYPEEPIAPGESDYIEITFDSKGYNGPIEKVVMVNSNAEGANVFVLTLMGNVI